MDVKLRQFVRVRAGQHCEYCGLPQNFPNYASTWSTLLRANMVVMTMQANADKINFQAFAQVLSNISATSAAHSKRYPPTSL